MDKTLENGREYTKERHEIWEKEQKEKWERTLQENQEAKKLALELEKLFLSR